MKSDYIIIGSWAAPFLRKDATINDIDIMYYGLKPDNIKIEKRADFHETPERIVNLLLENTTTKVITLNDLYTLKLSHVFWPIHHEKTINDIIQLSRRGCKVNKPLFSELKSYWETVHGNKDFLSLNRNKKDFFDDYVPKVVDHDLIHEWVAKYDEPLYKKCLKDNEEVLIDYNKFQSMDHDDQIHMIREEIMVIGIERFGILNNFKTPSGVCYNKAMRLTITNLLKNKFADFMAFNLDEIASYNMKHEYVKTKEIYNDINSRDN